GGGRKGHARAEIVDVVALAPQLGEQEGAALNGLVPLLRSGVALARYHESQFCKDRCGRYNENEGGCNRQPPSRADRPVALERSEDEVLDVREALRELGVPLPGALQEEAGKEGIAFACLGRGRPQRERLLDVPATEQEFLFLVKPGGELRPHPQQRFVRDLDF